MQKILVLYIVSIFVPYCYLYGVSVREYVQKYGVPSVEDGVLDLSGKNITSLEGLESIPQSDAIGVLNISKNKIRTVSAEAFVNFSQLQELNLSSNRIQMLPVNLFVYLGQLKCLNLRFNDIEVVPEDLFIHLSDLEILDLSYNSIKLLPENIFTALSNITRLNLGDNKLQVLQENIFKDLPKLRILELQGNQLRVLPKAIFVDLNLLILDLARNWFKETTQEFCQEYLASCINTVGLTYKDVKQEMKEWMQQYLFKQISLLTLQQVQEQKVLAKKCMNWLQDRVFWYDDDCDCEVSTQDDQGNTALHKAVKLCNPLLIKIIAKMFSRLVRVKNNWGQIPLHGVMTVKDKEISLALAKVLLAESFYPELLLQMQDNEGNTPVQVALNSNNYRVLQFLLAFGQGHRSSKLDYVLKQADIGKAFEQLRKIEKR